MSLRHWICRSLHFEGTTLFWKFWIPLPSDTTSYPIRKESPATPLRKPQNHIHFLYMALESESALLWVGTKSQDSRSSKKQCWHISWDSQERIFWKNWRIIFQEKLVIFQDKNFVMCRDMLLRIKDLLKTRISTLRVYYMIQGKLNCWRRRLLNSWRLRA
jgi:hypothetical protein